MKFRSQLNIVLFTVIMIGIISMPLCATHRIELQEGYEANHSLNLKFRDNKEKTLTVSLSKAQAETSSLFIAVGRKLMGQDYAILRTTRLQLSGILKKFGNNNQRGINLSGVKDNFHDSMQLIDTYFTLNKHQFKKHYQKYTNQLRSVLKADQPIISLYDYYYLIKNINQSLNKIVDLKPQHVTPKYFKKYGIKKCRQKKYQTRPMLELNYHNKCYFY